MAFTGFHVSLHTASRSTKDGAASMQIYGELIDSETLDTAGTTTMAVPSNVRAHIGTALVHNL